MPKLAFGIAFLRAHRIDGHWRRSGGLASAGRSIRVRMGVAVRRAIGVDVPLSRVDAIRSR